MQLLAVLIGVICYWAVGFLIDKIPVLTFLGVQFRSEFVFIPLPLFALLAVYIFQKKKKTGLN